MPDKRLAAVKRAFKYLDANNSGFLTLEFLNQQFQAAGHPRVTTREKNAAQVTQEFQSGISQVANQGRVSEEGFLNYYASLSATIPAENDEYFCALLVGCWAVNSSREYTSPERIEAMEDIFYEKIRQKTKPTEDEGKILVKLFRFFDTDGSGAVELTEFQGALERLGCTFTPTEVSALFNKYNPSGTGKLAYEELSTIFASKGAGNNNQFGSAREVPYAVLDKIKKILLKRGPYGIRELGNVLRRIDPSKSNSISRLEFEWGLRENGHQLSQLDLDRLFKYFDKNLDGRVAYNEFLSAIRGELNDKRKRIIEAVYRKFDINGNGIVNVEDMKAGFDVSFNPDFRAGRKTRDQILNEFTDNWDTLKKDGNITFEEFLDYYKDLSAVVDRDDAFELRTRNGWRLN